MKKIKQSALKEVTVLKPDDGHAAYLIVWTSKMESGKGQFCILGVKSTCMGSGE